MTGPGDEETLDTGVTPESEELALASDESLPWLESADYEDEGGVDTARIIGFALLGLIALALLIGAIWFFTRDAGDPELVADGSTIEAPEGPYKEKPEDPGGKEFAGTGNVAPAVGEGKVREGKLAEDTPKPSVATRSTEDKIEPVQAADTKSSASGGVGVQVGAYSTKASAETGWSTLTRQTDALSGVSHRIVQGTADIGTVYRLQAVAGDLGSARKLCSALKADGIACQVKP